jgi:hypothetical protein
LGVGLGVGLGLCVGLGVGLIEVLVAADSLVGLGLICLGSKSIHEILDGSGSCGSRAIDSISSSKVGSGCMRGEPPTSSERMLVSIFRSSGSILSISAKKLSMLGISRR